MTGNRYFFIMSLFAVIVLLLLMEISLPLVFGAQVFEYPRWVFVQLPIFIVFLLLLFFVIRPILKSMKNSEYSFLSVDQETLPAPGKENKEQPGQLIGTIVHEIRRPLSRLKLKLERLVNSEKIESFPEEFEQLEQTVASVEKVYRREQFAPRWISIPRLFELVAGAQNLVFRSGLSWVYCDPHQLKMALSNLIRNSRRAYETDSGKISIVFFSSGPEWCLSVQDFAGGMEKDAAATISGSARPLDYSGMGLGLILVKKICRNHRGRMLIKSTPGRGTKVMLTFPKPISEGI
ncbi:MAG: sensor histidine kinase [bacterium]